MGTVTAKQLKQRTGEVIRRVKSGERLTVTYRGKPVAIISPSTTGETKTLKELRSIDGRGQILRKLLERQNRDSRDGRRPPSGPETGLSAGRYQYLCY
jgi:prevent-host-death family protein